MIEPLLADWREEAQLYDRRGQAALAALMRSIIEDAERFIAELDLTPLTLTQAATECGYSASHLGRLVREGKIPNAGRPNAPLIARRDLPRKPVADRSDTAQLDRTQIVRLAIKE